MKKLIYIFALFAFGHTFGQSNINVNEKAPPIHITHWIENAPVDKDLINKYIVLEFWATWCGPCIAAVPHMNEIQIEFNQEDLYYISITDETVEKVERTLERIDFKSMVVTDLTGKTQINYGDGVNGLDTYPLTVLIDKTGIVKWIGEPKNLDATIMSSFLADEDIPSKEIQKAEPVEYVEKQKTYSFKDLVSNNEVKYYFEINPSEGSSEKSKMAMGTNIIMLGGYRLEDIYNEIMNIKSDQLKFPESLREKRFDLIYKSIEQSDNLGFLERSILEKLNLEKQTEIKNAKIYVVSVQDKSLLKETLEKRFSSKSDAGDKLIFTAYSIKNMLDELSNISSISFEQYEDIEIQYDFIVDTHSKDAILKSLKSYGLIVEEKESENEYITLTPKE